MSGAKDYRVGPIWRVLMLDLGINPADVLRLAGLPEDSFSKRELRVTAAELFALWTAAESLAAPRDLPMEIMDRASAEGFTPELFAALCSPNLAVAIDRLATYKQLCAPVRLEPETHADGGLTLTIRWTDATRPPPPSLSSMELAFVLRIARMGTRQNILPTRVQLPAAPTERHRHEAFFGVPIEVGDTGAIAFDRDSLHAHFLTSSDEMWAAFEPNLRKRLATLQATATTAQRVRAVLLESLPSGRANIGDVSQRLGLSARTLQRRLRTEDSNFNTILAAVREQLARHYLANTALPCNEIAFLLGYEEPNSFFRAFHGWTGESPERHRQAAAG